MHDLAQQALQLTQGGGDAGLSAVAHAMAGMSNFARGRFWVARVELEIALSLSGAAGRTSTFVAAEHNIAIASLWLAMTLLLLDLPAAAAERATAGLATARRLDNPHTLAHALALYCRYLSIAGDVRALHRAAEDLAVLAAEHRFPFYAAAADIYRGWVLAERDTLRGLRLLRDGTDAFVALGATGLRPWFLGRTALLSAAIGEVRAGIESARRGAGRDRAVGPPLVPGRAVAPQDRVASTGIVPRGRQCRARCRLTLIATYRSRQASS